VESTLSRVLLRAVGTVGGGALGLAVMMTPGLNHSPVGIMAVLCAVTFMVGRAEREGGAVAGWGRDRAAGLE
jgi:hypothetical protein